MTNRHHSQSVARYRFALHAGVAVLSVAVAAPVLAQAASTQVASVDAATADNADMLVVTGFRASLDASAKLKRLSPSIVESVSSEDIGKLPDVSIADSLARLPGVTAQRLEGRDQRLSIRGLGPDFGTTLLNGREQVTVGDNRGVEYDQYPSEFFKNVVVHKAADASLIAAGISGTVDLHMLRPLEQGKQVIAVQARAQMNGQKALNPDSSRYGYRASATYVDQFNDDTLGIAIGFSATRAPSQDERYNAWGFPNDVPSDPGSAAAVGNNLRLGGAKPYVQSNVLERYGAVATIEYQPSDNWHSTLDLLYSKFKETQHLRGIEFPINPGWGSGATLSNATVSNGFVTDLTVSNVHAVQRNDLNRRDADNFSAGWNNVVGLGGSTHLTVDASWSHSKRNDFLLETYTGTGYNTAGPADTLKVHQNPNGTFTIVPTLDYTNTNQFGLTDPRGWGYNGTTAVVQAGFLNKPSFKDDLKSLRASLDGEFGDSVFKGWEVGGNYSRRKKTSNFTSFFLCPKGAGTNCTVASGTPTFVPVPAAAKLGSNVALAYLGVPAMLTLDPLYLYNNSLNAAYDNRPVSLVRDNVVTENVLTGYALIKLDGRVGDVPLTGSIGAQVVHSRQSSDGSISNFSSGIVTVVPVSGRATYTNFLPSLALSIEPSSGLFVKFGASHTAVRPRLDQERINQDYSVDNAPKGTIGGVPYYFSSQGGNVNLRPYQSTNIDLSLERYFAHGGYIAVAGYYKRLTDFVDPSRSFLFDFAAAARTLPPGFLPAGASTIGLVSAPDNSGKGNLKGFEATLSLPLSNLTPVLDGFGFFGSASYTDSKITLASNPGNPITLPGLSDWVANAEAYYEKAGFQLRVSYRYRSRFLAEVAGLSANPDFRQAKAEGILDAQIGYEFQPGSPLAGLSILLQAKNLTDRPFITYQNNDPRQVIDYQRYGRDFYLGLAYKF